MKTITWEIHSRNLNSAVKTNHFWWKYAENFRTLEHAQDQCSQYRVADSNEYKIVRVETIRTETDENY